MLMCPAAHAVSAAANARPNGASLWSRGMNSEQNDSGSFQWAPILNGDLSQVFVERQHDACFGLRQIQQGHVACSSEDRCGPTERRGHRPEANLRSASESSHRRGGAPTLDRECLVFVGDIAGVRQTRQNVVARQPRVVGEEVVLRLASCQAPWLNSTARRVPRITGLPARIRGSTTMRSDSGINTTYRARVRFGSSPSPGRTVSFWSGTNLKKVAPEI